MRFINDFKQAAQSFHLLRTEGAGAMPGTAGSGPSVVWSEMPRTRSAFHLF
jgi:hypothetical protein